MEVLSSLIGVLIGGAITYFVEKRLQNRQLKIAGRERREIMKCYIVALKTSIEEDFKKLNELRNSGVFAREHFDIFTKRVIISEIIKSTIFVKHKEVFDQIFLLFDFLETLNQDITALSNILERRQSGDQLREVQENRKNAMLKTINDVQARFLWTNNGICKKLDEILVTL